MKTVYYLQAENGYKYTNYIYTSKKAAEEVAKMMTEHGIEGDEIKVMESILID